jgi:hypothetical protein
MTTRVLKHAKNRLGAIDWGPNDFDVLNADQYFGRIFLSPQGPQGRPWFWTITAMDYPRSIHSPFSDARASDDRFQGAVTMPASRQLGLSIISRARLAIML